MSNLFRDAIDHHNRQETPMGLVLKMRCNTKTDHKNGDETQQRFELLAVASDSRENAEWSKWTPSGNLGFTVTNPQALDALEVGREYLVRIEEA